VCLLCKYKFNGFSVMAIKSSTFGRVELSGNDAARFRQHMAEDKPNPKAIASLERGRLIMAKLKEKALIK
jgi:hypothetical protein